MLPYLPLIYAPLPFADQRWPHRTQPRKRTHGCENGCRQNAHEVEQRVPLGTGEGRRGSGDERALAGDLGDVDGGAETWRRRAEKSKAKHPKCEQGCLGEGEKREGEGRGVGWKGE